ncbi:hypothetical protein ACFW4X_02595 [Streptomyces smyrnaeus]|uniref:hypothetical protein n=1 Tax=Streptomyces smyrnaeus TaxID=1387713 RepID=UPI0036B27FDB
MKELPLRPGLMVEGNSDSRYLEALIRKQLAALVEHSDRYVEVYSCDTSPDVWTNKSAADVLAEAKSLARDCDLLFVHCDWDAADKAHDYVAHLRQWAEREKRAGEPVALVPVLMTESWMLADKAALAAVVPGLDISRYPYSTPAEVEKRVTSSEKGKGKGKVKLGPKQVWDQLLGRNAHSVLQDDADILVQHTDLTVLDKVPSYRAWREATEEALRPRYL